MADLKRGSEPGRARHQALAYLASERVVGPAGLPVAAAIGRFAAFQWSWFDDPLR